MSDLRENTRPRLPLGASLLLTFCLMFFMSFSVCAEVVLCRYMVVLVFVILLLVAVRSKLATWLLALPCLLAFLSAGTSPALPLLLCAIAVISFGGFAITAMHPLLTVAAPTLAYLLAFVLTGNPLQALSVLAFVPLAIAVAIALRLRLSRTASIVLLSVSTVVYAAVALVLALPEGVAISAEGIANFISQFREMFVQEYMTLAETPEYASTLQKLTEEQVVALVNSAFRLLPAFVIVALEIFAYLAGLLAVSLHSAQLPEHPLPKSCLGFRMSATSAVLFLICFIASCIPLGKSDTVGILLITALNLFVILIPGFAVCGLIRIFLSFRQKRLLSPIFLIVLAIWFAYALPTLLAFIGAFATLRAERLAKRTRKG